jgi:hypothetical protein
VLSREVIPVPPVVITTSADTVAARTAAATGSGSSLRIFRPLMVWPALLSASTIAAPAVSVASVRESLMVRTKTRTDAGASARCEVGASTGGL